MASTITASTLKVTLEENLVLNGKVQGNKNTFSVGTVNEASQRILTVPSASEVTVVSFGTAVGAGTYVTDNIRYIRIKNLDDTNWVRVRLFADLETDKIADVLVQPGQFFMLGSPKISDTAVFSAFTNLTSIKMQSNAADVDVELLVVSA